MNHSKQSYILRAIMNCRKLQKHTVVIITSPCVFCNKRIPHPGISRWNFVY
ncbi:hypothetical protein LLY41_01930 [Cytobacillus firmus]|nr:hypothetical protein LLY41_01930 [Cytobacillus firmus]